MSETELDIKISEHPLKVAELDMTLLLTIYPTKLLKTDWFG